MSNTPHQLLNYIQQIKDKRKSALISIYNDHSELFHKALGGNNHQKWNGGYADHIAECLMINDVTYDALNNVRQLEFSKDGAAIALFFHDIEKPFKNISTEYQQAAYWQNRQKETGKNWEEIKWDILEEMKNKYSFQFSSNEINALQFTHGEGESHRKDMRVSTPLAAHVHHCDNTSARIWHDHGREQRQSAA